MYKIEPDLPNEIPDTLILKTGQQESIIRAISEITDIDPFVITSCTFEAPELARLFRKAASYHNEISSLHETLQEMDTEHFSRLYSNSTSTLHSKGHTANAMKITARLDHYEHRLQRLTDGITLRAQLKTKP